MEALSWVLAIGIASVWIWSAASKWTMPHAVELYGVIRDVFPAIPSRLVERFSVVLPKVELALGIGLLIPQARRWASAGSLALLSSFTVFLIRAWSIGYEKSCGCFGESVPLTAQAARAAYGLAVARNTLLIAAAVYLIWFARSGSRRLRTSVRS